MITLQDTTEQNARSLMSSMSQDLSDTFKIMQSDVLKLVIQAGEKGWTVEELENKIDALLIDPNAEEIDTDEIVEDEMNE